MGSGRRGRGSGPTDRGLGPQRRSADAAVRPIGRAGDAAIHHGPASGLRSGPAECDAGVPDVSGVRPESAAERDAGVPDVSGVRPESAAERDAGVPDVSGVRPEPAAERDAGVPDLSGIRPEPAADATADRRVPYLDGDQKKGPSKGVLAVALVVAGLLLLAVVGLGIMLIGGGGADSPSSASAPVTSTLPRASTAPPRTSEPPATSAPDLSQIPGGVGEAIGAAGAAVGTITSNDGSTLILDGIGGSAVTVATNESTKIISLSGAKVGDLKPGDTVVVQGEKGDDGSVLAKVIVNTTLPDLGNFGN
ncbi:hypothetical protein BTZ20_0880 [Rhodococcus sp. MTM3W5.2]|nr:hypothetical protein BTZ20_0880 [Rhodococcus sp. MTM3W5.2]